MGSSNRRFAARIATLAVAAFAAIALAGCSQININTNSQVEKNLTPVLNSGSTIADGVLTVGINAANSPYGGTNSANETVGLDVDIAAAIASELGMKLQIVDVNSNGKSALSSKQVDLALGLTKSGNNNTVTYSNAYINDGSSLYTLSSNAENAAANVKDFDKNVDKIAVQANTTAALEVQEALGIDAIKSQGNIKEAFDALQNGEAKYLAADAVLGDYMATNYSDIVRVDYLSPESVTPMYAVTLTENVELTQGVAKALDTITSNGVLRVVVDKWLGKQGEQLLPGNVDIAKVSELFGEKTK